MPKWLRSPISPKGDRREDVFDGGVCEAVSMRGVRMAIFPAGVSSEFRNAAGGVWKQDDTDGCGEEREGRTWAEDE